MENRIREHVEELFREAPQTRKTLELKEEMVQNLVEKYHDLVAEGKNEKAAYEIVIAGIGDVGELIDDLKMSYVSDPFEERKAKQRSALFTSIAVMMYILSVVPLIIMDELNMSEVAGIAIMFVMIALATGLLIYNNMTKVHYRRTDDTVVEEFKEWKADRGNNRSAKDAISGIVWSLTIAAYFLISFATGAWHITWVIFIIGMAVKNIVKIVMDLSKS